MTLSATDAATAAQDLWQSQTDDAAFWSSLQAWVDAQKLEKGDLVTLLNAVRDLCDVTYAGPYGLPSPPGSTATGGPMFLFASWASLLYCKCVSGGALGSLLSGLSPGMRRDAACDVGRLVASWLDGTPIFQSPIPVLSTDPGSPWMNYVNDGLNIAGSLAFAVPVVGPYLGTALQAVASLVKLFFPTGQTPSVGSVVTKELGEADAFTAANNLAVDAGWLSDICNTLSQEKAPLADSEQWIVASVQGPLIARLSGTTPTDTNLLTLVDFVDAPGVIELLSSGISTYLALCRQLVLTDLSLAAVAQANVATDGVDACLQRVASSLLDLTRLQQAIAGVPGGQQTANANWAAQFNALLLQVAAGRLSEIKYSLNYTTFTAPFIADIDDGGKPPGTTTKSFEQAWKGGNATLSEQVAAMTQTFLQTTWTTYVQSVGTALDSLYASHFALIESWMQSLTGWAGMLPLPPADWAPTVAAWTSGTPNGAVWVPGAQVRYVVINANANGIVTPGTWTAWLPITTGGCPTLQLQPPTGSTEGYWVCRQVIQSGSMQIGPTVLVGKALGPEWAFTDNDTNSVGIAQMPRARVAGTRRPTTASPR